MPCGHNLPGSPAAKAKDKILGDGHTYEVNGWRVELTTGGTRFTNDPHGHGMCVSKRSAGCC
ncbi:hypothetical protein A5710_20860 [Mycolicibacter sinensis]|uniref:Uncharacterized protein n=1 Tax=Mycolicibacter sinensis (strain JDM601) TaxID=875328 RepID=A0A1A2XXQ0_MYCSD|nr:hypothetical protein A5710_20860 [Mycolicibacter sinensis]